VEGLKKAYTWDVSGRAGLLPDAGVQFVAHEFDFKRDGGVVYEGNGVKILVSRGSRSRRPRAMKKPGAVAR
jgi:hypothetical protein